MLLGSSILKLLLILIPLLAFTISTILISRDVPDSTTLFVISVISIIGTCFYIFLIFRSHYSKSTNSTNIVEEMQIVFSSVFTTILFCVGTITYVYRSTKNEFFTLILAATFRKRVLLLSTCVSYSIITIMMTFNYILLKSSGIKELLLDEDVSTETVKKNNVREKLDEIFDQTF